VPPPKPTASIGGIEVNPTARTPGAVANLDAAVLSSASSLVVMSHDDDNGIAITTSLA